MPDTLIHASLAVDECGIVALRDLVHHFVPCFALVQSVEEDLRMDTYTQEVHVPCSGTFSSGCFIFSRRYVFVEPHPSGRRSALSGGALFIFACILSSCPKAL